MSTKPFILIFMVIILTACSSYYKPNKTVYVNINGKYTSEASEARYSAIIQEDSIKIFRQSFRDQMDGSRVWTDSCPVMIASGTFYQDNNYIIVRSLPIDPFKDIADSYISTENDSTTLTLRIPNYDFSKGTYPIIDISVIFTHGNPHAMPGDSDYMEPEYYEMKVECRTDNVVVHLPKKMKQGAFYFVISQSEYINYNKQITPYLCNLTYEGAVYNNLVEDSKENIIITLPNLTNQVFETMYFERAFIPYDKDHLYFFNIDLKKETTESE